MSSQGVEGSIPAQLGSLSVLEDLTVERTSLFGTIPPELGCPTALQELRLQQKGRIGRKHLA